MFTRCRPEKNDQAHVEEKNWLAVRKLVGYGRYESPEALGLMKAIYAISGLFLNFFQPVRKLLAKERVGDKVRKKVRPGTDSVPEGAGLTLGKRGNQGQVERGLRDPDSWEISMQDPKEPGTAKEAPWVTAILRQPQALR